MLPFFESHLRRSMSFSQMECPAPGVLTLLEAEKVFNRILLSLLNHVWSGSAVSPCLIRPPSRVCSLAHLLSPPFLPPSLSFWTKSCVRCIIYISQTQELVSLESSRYASASKVTLRVKRLTDDLQFSFFLWDAPMWNRLVLSLTVINCNIFF